MQTLYLTAPYHYHHLFFKVDGEQRNAEGETRYNISIIPTPLTDISVIIHIMDAVFGRTQSHYIVLNAHMDLACNEYSESSVKYRRKIKESTRTE